MDVSKDGALAAASARKLDKGGYSLKDAVARRDVKVTVESAELWMQQ